jgi:uncharacterized protein YlxP (DUF503 family)
MTAWVGVIACELMVPGAVGLKDKRRAVKSLVERMHRRCRVSVAETGLHDLHQRAEISVAVVAGSEGELERLLEALRALARELPEAVVAHWDERVIAGLDSNSSIPSMLKNRPNSVFMAKNPAAIAPVVLKNSRRETPRRPAAFPTIAAASCSIAFC